MDKISPRLLSKYLGQEHAPTEQQAAIVGAEPGPLLVVAGAGAGKTETMAARVVWLVANGYATPDQVLGLTFTRKAAQQLSQRIRKRLEVLAGIPRLDEIDPTGQLKKNLQAITPTVSTYDSYAGTLIREYGLLLPVEPSARLITQTELYHIARGVVDNYRGELMATQTPATVTEYLLGLVSEMDNHMVTAEDILEESEPFIRLFEELPKAPRQKNELNKDLSDWRDTQITRLQYLPLVKQLKQELHERAVITFGEQMSKAARLASLHPQVGYSQRRRFRVVMLDEYQDTSHSQRVLLRSLFGGTDPGLTVTAVGDPMQAIYGWRGATAANLENFVEDFPVITLDGNTKAPKNELTTSWRNPPEVLTLANAVSREVLGPPESPTRTVQPLNSRDGAPQGDVSIAWFDTAAKERSFVADQLEKHWNAREGEGSFTAAVLVRKRRHSAPIAEELLKRGIPVEVVGLSGLLDVPEIADLVAIATMMVRPQDNRAALRILGGPHVGLGIKDMQRLQERARNLAGRVTRERRQKEADPLAELEAIIDEVSTSEPEAVVGLSDAISDLGEPERYSAEGLLRLRRLSAQLRYLRTHSLARSVADIFADIEEVFNIRTEVLAREDPHADGATGTVHLDKFAAEVAQHSSLNLPQLLDYFDLARSQEDGLEPGEVTVRSDRVQILTAHKAKGLEWEIVSVLHADAGTYEAKPTTWLTNIPSIPSSLRGDAGTGVPELNTAVEDRKELEIAGKEYKAEVKQGLAEENSRLFYVGITRSERVLMVTGSAVDESGAKTPKKPYEHLEILRAKAPEAVVEWWEGETDDVEKPLPAEGTYPHASTHPAVEAGAALVRGERVPPNTEGGLESLWEKEVTALIDEHRRLSAPSLEVEISRELTATDLVALKNNPEQFARRLRRPVPFKPNTYAKRGTQFHQWLEDRFGATSLLDEDELPGIGEEISDRTFDELREAFIASEWEARTPEFVEHPFEVVIGEHVIRGRMDAVFRNPDGSWMVVDWKTGHPPTGKEMEAAIIQLAVYRIAWAQLQHLDPEEVRAAFHYVAHNHTFEPRNLPTSEALAALLSGERPKINQE
ncbi:UvrD-helicase domain-containing protein [Corynebacterium callunae]|uniref:ATP-dependent helicase n=1 Tax=Corynebacterium callunae TaxID=1721 RepID=UPI0039823CFD